MASSDPKLEDILVENNNNNDNHHHQQRHSMSASGGIITAEPSDIASTTTMNNNSTNPFDDENNNHQQVPTAIRTTANEPDKILPSDDLDKQKQQSDDNKEDNDDNQQKENFRYYEDLDIISIPASSSWLYTTNRSHWLNFLGLIVLIPFGMLEGFSFFKVGIVDPLAFSGQFTLSAWVILNLFIAAVGGSMVVFSLFELFVPSFWARKSDSRNNKTGYLRAIIGGSVCGIGMALAGVGSTMLPAQVGGGVKNSWASVVGFFLGALVFSIIEKFFLKEYLETSCKFDRKTEKLTMDEKVGIRFHKIGIPAGLMMIGFACALEFGIPGTKTDDNSEKLSMGKLGWPAIAGGLVVALNQAVLLLIGNHQQGGSTCIVNVVSLLSGGYLAPQYFPFTSDWKPRWGVHVGQFVLVWIGTSIGSKIAEVTSGPEQYSPRAEIAIWRQIVGGFLSIFGARYSDSCACGGLTSVGSMSIEGTLLAMFMFGSAIGTGFIIQAVE